MIEKNTSTGTNPPNARVPHYPKDDKASPSHGVERTGREGREPAGFEHEDPIHWRDLNRILFVAAAAGALWFVPAPTSFYLGIGVLCAAVGGYPIYREAIENLLERRMTMELSMAIAILAALAIREVFTALVITLFVLVAEVLEGFTVGKGRRAIRHLIDLLPRTATVRRQGTWVDIGIQELLRGDIVLVKPGGRIPVDGSVKAGHSFVDQASITGESMPIEKIPGAQVFAGTINQSGAIEVSTVKLGRDTAFGRIIDAVEHAENSRAPIQKTADQLAGYLVYFAIACAILTLILTHNLRSTISVVIVAGACGIAAGTPLAILGAIGRAARNGAIVKGGLYMQVLGKVDTVVLEKTGTLTLGNPEVTDVRACPGIKREDVLAAAASAERFSEHPLAKAILKSARDASISISEPKDFNYSPGKGIVCSVDNEEVVVGSGILLAERSISHGELETDSNSTSEIYVGRAGRLLGSIRVADVLRSEAVSAVRTLREMGIRTEMLTGDADAIARTVGKQLGVDAVESDLLPQQKLDRVKTLVRENKTVAMVGDGINDAPALMQASVGVAMGSGTDVARESADVVLLGNDLMKFVELLKIARRCRHIIMTNFAGTLLVDSVGVGLAAFGFLNPVLAAIIHVSSEMVFILNSARLLASTRERNS
ncbi:MAG TPA: cation-translocating P-type ATPase [Terriglobia bacterium]|nr:cation-translocating P-type ATPase [Terriglobia bacterium]